MLDGSNDVTDLDPLDYADVLGPSGLARIRQLATEALRRRPSGRAERYLMERPASLRAELKRRRKLMSILDRCGL